jgi:hypothetical protein
LLPMMFFPATGICCCDFFASRNTAILYTYCTHISSPSKQFSRVLSHVFPTTSATMIMVPL